MKEAENFNRKNEESMRESPVWKTNNIVHADLHKNKNSNYFNQCSKKYQESPQKIQYSNNM